MWLDKPALALPYRRAGRPTVHPALNRAEPMPTLKPFDPTTLLLIAALNPVVIAIGLWMGMKADQWQKLIVAALAAALGGFLALYVAILVGLIHREGIGGEAGIVALQSVFGFIWAVIGWTYARWREKR